MLRDRRIECPRCHKEVAVNPASDRLRRHGDCPGSGMTIDVAKRLNREGGRAESSQRPAPVPLMRRCRVCGEELFTQWGPETHTESERQLRAHVEGHSDLELRAFVMRLHFGTAG